MVLLFAILVPSLSWGQIAFYGTSPNPNDASTSSHHLCIIDQSGSLIEKWGGGGGSWDLSPDGTTIAYVWLKREMGTSSYYLHAHNFLESSYWTIWDSATYAYKSAIRWSPAGDNLVAFLLDNQEIRVMAAENFWERDHSNELFKRVIDVGMHVSDIDWAPNERFVVSSGTEEIWITDGTNLEFLSRGQYPRVSPDGKKIAFVVPGKSFSEYDDFPDAKISGYENSVWTMNLDGSHKRFIHKWEFGSRGVAWSPDSRELAFADGVKMWESYVKAVSLNGVVRTILHVEKRVRKIEWAAPWLDQTTGITPASWGAVKHEQNY